MTVLTFSSIKSTSINENRNQTPKSDSYFYLLFLSGETGIRTLGTVTRSPHFECGPIDHSGISPKRLKRLLKIQKALYRAERQGFEPRVPRGTTVFKTAAIDHSATSPNFFVFCFSKAMQRYALFLNMQAFGQKKFEERKYSLRFAYLCRGII